jgi:hypothetical protein
MWADGASATYGEGDRSVRIHVTDMIRVSTCEPGSWQRHLEQLEASKPGEAQGRVVELGNQRGKMVEIPGEVRTLTIRLGDRCTMVLDGESVPPKQLRAVALGLRLDPLAEACARREPSVFGLGAHE